MKTLKILAMVAILSMVVSADGVPTVVTYVPNSKVTEVMTKGGEIVNDKGLIILANRRGAGEVEVHDKTNHIFIIVEGEATFVTGGTLVGAKNTAPGQIRAASLTGGQTHQLKKGDVITIPAKTPHWWKEVSTKTIAYYAINTEP
ncbi:MAG TPA: cupin domain-containing protein [Vicinamibacterales bacterium]|jgi:mannose-6-phosphate isomerase-like protein (cupin superfamily)